MTFRVGQQVVCVYNGEDYAPFPTPEYRKIYTIKAIHSDPNVYGLGISLDEIPDPPEDDDCAPWWFSGCFRPVVKTDISIFTAMLNPAPHRENIDA